jgi:hypothetical protein
MAPIREPFHRRGWVYEEKVDGNIMLALSALRRKTGDAGIHVAMKRADLVHPRRRAFKVEVAWRRRARSERKRARRETEWAAA